jgi:hypothetical protein
MTKDDGFSQGLSPSYWRESWQARFATVSGYPAGLGSGLMIRASSPHLARRGALNCPPHTIPRVALRILNPSYLAVRRTHSIKSFAAGLSARFLSVTIATGRGCAGSRIGSTLREPPWLPKRRIDVGSIVTNCALAASRQHRCIESVVMGARGNSVLLARNNSAVSDPCMVSAGGRIQRSPTRSASLSLRIRAHLL